MSDIGLWAVSIHTIPKSCEIDDVVQVDITILMISVKCTGTPDVVVLREDVGTPHPATQDAAKVIMSRISGHCVKLMLPTLLGGLEEKQWRTKKGSIELLG